MMVHRKRGRGVRVDAGTPNQAQKTDTVVG
jgi:hypothetical protein